MLTAKVKVTDSTEYPFLATDRASKKGVYLMMHECPDHQGAWCGYCIVPGEDKLFAVGDWSEDISSSAMVAITEVTIHNGLE